MSAGAATASYSDGILTITLPKAESQPVSIPVVPAPVDTHSVESGEEEEEDKAYAITLAAPGIKASDFSLEAHRGVLTVKGETKRGASTSSIHRKLRLPRQADVGAATATTKDGLLTIRLPEGACEGSQHIPIGSSTEQPTPESPVVEASASSSVLNECEASVADVQSPDEGADDFEMVPVAEEKREETHTAGESVNEAAEEASEWRPEWDELLDDLSEMGFDDREQNRKLLVTYSGSIKQAVRELVASRKGDATVV